MSIEILATMITGLGLVVTLGSSMFVGFAWMLRRIDDVQAELVDVKVSVARWEGPRPQLQTRR
ncbi:MULTISPECIES: hypothetical protein [unclassified Microbacterium]|uniref:hypothetical protein n=1 Tax=unclassified Microbacterium TaxID=2609290 RepID=UPI00300FE9AE